MGPTLVENSQQAKETRGVKTGGFYSRPMAGQGKIASSTSSGLSSEGAVHAWIHDMLALAMKPCLGSRIHRRGER